MAVATSETRATTQPAGGRVAAVPVGRKLLRMNWLGGSAGWLWLVVVMVPLYWIVVTSFKDQTAYFTHNPLSLPTEPTLDELPAGDRVRLPAVLPEQRDRCRRHRDPGGRDRVHGGVRDRPRRRQPVPRR